jgi:hypothetical protein
MISKDVENIIEIQKKRSMREELVKQKVLSMIKDKIHHYAFFGHTNCVCKIPHFILGEVPYKLESMSKFVIKKLKSEGFYIIKLNMEHIYISWNINDIATQNQTKKATSSDTQSDAGHNYTAFMNISKSTF